MTDKEKREIKDGVISIFKRFNILDHTATIGSLRDDILRYINSLKEETVSEGLEEAANFYADTHTEWFDADNNPHVSPAFKAGANWQKEQMMTKAFDGEILENYDGKVIKYDDTILDEKLSDCKVFDKVKIIVIKEG